MILEMISKALLVDQSKFSFEAIDIIQQTADALQKVYRVDHMFPPIVNNQISRNVCTLTKKYF